MNYNQFSYLLIIIIYHIGHTNINAQNNGLRAYTLEDGLPQSQVYDIIQDNIGYLWLGTRGGGLSRFNGEEFKVWNENDGLLSNYIQSLAMINDSLFIGTRRGLSIKTKESFYNIKGLQINKIFRIKNKTYFATNLGVHWYNNHKIEKIILDKKINTSIVHDIVFDGKLFWIATNKGLWKLSTLQKNAKIIQRHSKFNFTAALYHNEKVFASVLEKGILVLNTNAKSYGNNWINEPKHINTISAHDDQLWLSTNNEGIIVINTKNYTLLRKINQKNGLSISNIRKSIKDKQSNIWIATSGGGLYKLFKSSFAHYDQDIGLKANRVYAVHSYDNEIWASNSEAGLIKIDENGIKKIKQDERLKDVKIKTITNDVKGNIWAGTDGKGILLKKITRKDTIVVDSTDLNNLKSDTIKKSNYDNYIINKKQGLPANWISSLLLSKDTIWAATYADGITRFVYDYKKNKIRRIKNFTKRNGLKDLEITDLIRGKKGEIWYTTKNGDIGYLKRNKVVHMSDIINQEITINTLLFRDNKIFLSTDGQGIWWSDYTSKKLSFKKLTGKKDLYSNNIYQMIFDTDGHLWVGNETGAEKIILDTNNQINDTFHYDRNDGFLGMETYLNAVTKDYSGNIWFGAIYGLTKYKYGENTESTVKPEIHFENVEVSYQSLDSINPDSWAKSNRVLQLSPQQTELSFSYKTVDLDHPRNIEYRYRLNNTAWSPWSTDNRQNLAGLAYGKHSFSAQSRNYRWEESNPITFNLFIDSPIYKKIWFQLLLVGLLLIILSSITFSYIRRVKLNNKEEREKLQMQNHLLSLEQKALRLQMNPHFIFNVLNGIKAMGTSNPQKMNNTINSFATLLRETLYNSREDHITLDQEMKTLKNYIEVEKLMANKVFEYALSIDSELDPEEVLIPPMLIQPFVENAIRHGILKGNKDGKLKVLFNTTEEFLHCKVIDNGLGIFQSQKTKTKTDHQSMALTVTRERLESISGKDALEINEITENDGSIAGTQITFKIPLLTDY